MSNVEHLGTMLRASAPLVTAWSWFLRVLCSYPLSEKIQLDRQSIFGRTHKTSLPASVHRLGDAGVCFCQPLQLFRQSQPRGFCFWASTART